MLALLASAVVVGGAGEPLIVELIPFLAIANVDYWQVPARSRKFTFPAT